MVFFFNWKVSEDNKKTNVTGKIKIIYFSGSEEYDV